jgi:hypothetical protein
VLNVPEASRVHRARDARAITAEDTLVAAGFPASDDMVDGIVYVGRDAQVSLAAPREMVQGADSGKEQCRTSNVIRRSLTKICINGSTFTGVFSTSLDLAIQNYDEQPLTFAIAHTPSAVLAGRPAVHGRLQAASRGLRRGRPDRLHAPSQQRSRIERVLRARRRPVCLARAVAAGRLAYGAAYDIMVSDFDGDGASDYLLHLKARHESSVYRSRNGAFTPRVLASQDGFGALDSSAWMAGRDLPLTTRTKFRVQPRRAHRQATTPSPQPRS